VLQHVKALRVKHIEIQLDLAKSQQHRNNFGLAPFESLHSCNDFVSLNTRSPQALME
jgi:hypothetical protein